jgi:CRISPR system Cascade subunit CasA
MNLLEEHWMPVRLHDGGREWIAPHQLCDPRIAAFDADRADFNGALAQFAIGLLQTTTPVDNLIEWRALFNTPPDSATLADWFLPCKPAFVFDGDGARFMQDFDLRLTDGEWLPIGNLLIETPGENTLKNNSDHFIKRGRLSRLCPSCAALSLFTLQVNAPAGGAGHRTGLRGGGPLTTLLLTEARQRTPRTLWHDLWLNVRERQAFLASGGDAGKTAPNQTFPWLASASELQSDGGSLTPLQTHPAHVFWAMPRRIRLDFQAIGSGVCDICERVSDQVLSRYVTRNFGLNYKGPWSHPLSPYYESKKGWLPLHPQPGGLGYRHWLWVFGYDMDNMKARCWYESTMPLYALSDCDPSQQSALREEIGSWIAGADCAVSFTRGAIRDAWFSNNARGEFSFVDAAFWGQTEPVFYELLRTRIQAARDGFASDRQETAERWRSHLRTAAWRLFDRELVGTGPVERQNPARIAKAHHQLGLNLDGPKMRAALGLPAKSNPKPKKTKDAQAA